MLSSYQIRFIEIILFISNQVYLISNLTIFITFKSDDVITF